MRALLVCRRRGSAGLSERDVAVLDARLRPDNLPPRMPRVLREHGVAAVIFNPPERVETSGASVCVGALCGGQETWAEPGSPAPDGSFALLRVGDHAVELVADAVGSRTIWYAANDDLFVASTSQRAVTSVLRSFEPNRRAFAWMLSSGSLGPGLGWDARVGSVPAGGRVRLDRTTWRVAVQEPTIEVGGGLPRAATPHPSRPGGARLRGGGHQRRLEHALEQVFAGHGFDPTRWILPLSGGVDSRGILLFLESRACLESVTWGIERSLADPRSDGRIAERLANHFGLVHRFRPISVSREPRERLIERFLVAGEGRTDRLSGYLDGFEIWRAFAEQGWEGVIRGDEAFGWNAVRTEADVLRECGITRLADVLDEQKRAAFALPEQALPPALERRAGESLASWRDRLYQQFRLPVLLAALTDLKSAYVEVANPLLSSSVIECVRTLPDGLRTDKRLWRAIVTQRSPAIPFAARTGVYPLREFAREPATLELMLEELGSDASRDVLGDELARSVFSDLERLRAEAAQQAGVPGRGVKGARIAGTAGTRTGARFGSVAGGRLGSLVGGRVGRVLKRGVRAILLAPENTSIEREIFALRAFLIARTVAMLRGDAKALDHDVSDPARNRRCPPDAALMLSRRDASEAGQR